ncbi:MAG TPA: hypothetical protein VGD24_01380 [Gallionella sp.]
MRYILITITLLFAACDNSTPTPKIAAPQREALEKAKAVEQVVQQGAEETKQQVEDAGQ